jgi:hypothetical protein
MVTCDSEAKNCPGNKRLNNGAGTNFCSSECSDLLVHVDLIFRSNLFIYLQMFLGAASVNRGKKKDVADRQNQMTRSVMQKVPEGGDKSTPFWIAGENRSVVGNNGKGVSQEQSGSPKSLEKVKLPRLPVYDDLGQTSDRYCI